MRVTPLARLAAVAVLGLAVAPRAVADTRVVRTQSSAPEPALLEPLRQWTSEFGSTVSRHVQQARPPVFGAHLLVADSNRGPALLDQTTLPGVLLTLDRFRELGIRGVTLAIGYPLLVNGFPDGRRYLKFYAAVARAVRQRGMRLAVEQIVLFSNSVFSPWRVDFRDLTLTRFTAQQHQMAQTIIDAVHPDYLTVLHEPDTYATLTGLTQFNHPSSAAQYVRGVLRGLRRGTTKVGAGSGTWSNPDYVRQFAARTNVNYIDLHVYWTYPGAISAGYRMAQLARANHKPIVIDEAWLYKSIGTGVEGTASLAGWEAVFRRDVFDIFQPLDASFLTDVSRFARTVGARYISPFWTNQFFAYVPYTPATQALSYQNLQEGLEPSSAAWAITADRFTATGLRYRDIIRAARRH
jgi:hypothetical protein